MTTLEDAINMLPDEQLREYISRSTPNGSNLLDFDRSTLEIVCQSILNDSSHLTRTKFIENAEHFVTTGESAAVAVVPGRSIRKTLNDFMPPEFATEKPEDTQASVSYESEDEDDDDEVYDAIPEKLRCYGANKSKKYNKTDPRQDDVIDFLQDGFWDLKAATKVPTSEVNASDIADAVPEHEKTEEIEEAVYDELEDEENGDDEVDIVEEDYPLPQAFKDKVDLLIHLGFENKARVVEVLIENAGKIEDAADQLKAERKKLVEEKKVQARQELLSFLDTEKGDELLEKLAELNLAGNPDVLANLFAIAKSDWARTL